MTRTTGWYRRRAVLRRAIVVVSYSVLGQERGVSARAAFFLFRLSSRVGDEPKNLVHTFVKIFTFARDIFTFFPRGTTLERARSRLRWQLWKRPIPPPPTRSTRPLRKKPRRSSGASPASSPGRRGARPLRDASEGHPSFLLTHVLDAHFSSHVDVSSTLLTRRSHVHRGNITTGALGT